MYENRGGARPPAADAHADVIYGFENNFYEFSLVSITIKQIRGCIPVEHLP